MEQWIWTDRSQWIRNQVTESEDISGRRTNLRLLRCIWMAWGWSSGGPVTTAPSESDRDHSVAQRVGLHEERLEGF
jgi:hypothetical protein